MKPTLSELEKFEDQPEGIDLEVVTESGTSLYVTLCSPVKTAVCEAVGPTVTAWDVDPERSSTAEKEENEGAAVVNLPQSANPVVRRAGLNDVRDG